MRPAVKLLLAALMMLFIAFASTITVEEAIEQQLGHFMSNAEANSEHMSNKVKLKDIQGNPHTYQILEGFFEGHSEENKSE